MVILVCRGFTSCTNHRSDIQQETEILNDIFLQVTSDSWFFPLTPPPPAKIIDDSGNVKDDSLHNPNLEEYYSFVSRLDTSRNVISIEDSTDIIIDDSIVIEKLREYGLETFVEIFNKEKRDMKLPISIDQIKKTGRYELIGRSSLFPKGFNFKQYNGFDLNFYFFGNMIFSRPFLDKSLMNGFMIYSRECGFECDGDYVLIIKKQNNKWTIVNKI